MEVEKWGMVAALAVWVKGRTKMGEKNHKKKMAALRNDAYVPTT